MNSESLIAEVHKRPALWNQKDVSYHNRDVTNRAWTELSAMFKLPKQLLKTKWKGLRDTFRAEMKKERACKKSKLARNRTVWAHFETLEFLKEQMSPRAPIWERTSSIAGPDGNDNARTALRTRSNDVNNKNRVSGRSVAASSVRTKNNRPAGKGRAERRLGGHEKFRARNVMTSVMVVDGDRVAEISEDANSSKVEDDAILRDNLGLAVKIEPTEHCELNFNGADESPDEGETSLETSLESDELTSHDPLGSPLLDRYDDNYYFFVSLLPHMRSLPAERRMLLRMQMQQLVYEQVYKKSSSTDVDRAIIAAKKSAPISSVSSLRDKHL